MVAQASRGMEYEMMKWPMKPQTVGDFMICQDATGSVEGVLILDGCLMFAILTVLRTFIEGMGRL